MSRGVRGICRTGGGGRLGRRYDREVFLVGEDEDPKALKDGAGKEPSRQGEVIAERLGRVWDWCEWTDGVETVREGRGRCVLALSRAAKPLQTGFRWP